MKKLPAVTSVRVSLNDGLTILDLEPGNAMTMAELRRIIKHNGFATKEAAILARGVPGGNPQSFIVSGTNELLVLSSPPERSGDDWHLTAKAPVRP